MLRGSNNMKGSPSDLCSLILGLGLNTCSNVCQCLESMKLGKLDEESLPGLCLLSRHLWPPTSHRQVCVRLRWGTIETNMDQIIMVPVCLNYGSPCILRPRHPSVHTGHHGPQWFPCLLLTSKDGEDNTTGSLNEMCPIVSGT